MGQSAAQLQWGHRLRSHLDLLRPNFGTKVSMAQARQKAQQDQHSQSQQLAVGDTVQMHNYRISSNKHPALNQVPSLD